MLRTTLRHYAPSPTNVPKLKKRYPILGHIKYFGDTDGDFAKALTLMHKAAGPTFRFDVMRNNFVVTSDVELMKKVMCGSSDNWMASRPKQWQATKMNEDLKLPQGILTAEGDQWQKQRRVVEKNFSKVSDAEKYRPLVQEKAKRLVDAMETSLVQEQGDSFRVCDGVTLKQFFALYALEVMTQLMLSADLGKIMDQTPTKENAMGGPIVSPEEALRFAKDIELWMRYSDAVDQDMLAKWFPEQRKSYKKLQEVARRAYGVAGKLVAPAMQQHDKDPLALDNPSEGVLPQLMKQRDGKVLSNTEVLSVGVVSCVSAVDTTSQSLEFLMMNLGRDVDAQTRLREELKEKEKKNNWLQACISESMRLTPTANMHGRVLNSDVTHPHVRYNPLLKADEELEMVLPKGTTVILNFLEASQDPRYFKEDPTKFVPSRWLPTAAETQKVDMVVSELLEKDISGVGSCPFHASGALGQQELGSACPADVTQHPFAADLAFGAGGRRCPGAGLARVMMECAAEELFRRFGIQYVSTAAGEGEDMTYSSLMRPTTKTTPMMRFKKL